MESLIRFWRYAARLKREQRRGWRRLRLGKIESVADHSFAVALLALFEGERRKCDMERILTLALVHDLGEAITGDLTPDDKKKLGTAKVLRDRERAMRELAQTLPENSRRNFLRLWRDLRLLRTREARLVHQLDKIEMALQASEYEKRVGREKIADFYRTATRETKDESLRRLLSSITKGLD